MDGGGDIYKVKVKLTILHVVLDCTCSQDQGRVPEVCAVSTLQCGTDGATVQQNRCPRLALEGKDDSAWSLSSLQSL